MTKEKATKLFEENAPKELIEKFEKLEGEAKDKAVAKWAQTYIRRSLALEERITNKPTTGDRVMFYGGILVTGVVATIVGNIVYDSKVTPWLATRKEEQKEPVNTVIPMRKVG